MSGALDAIGPVDPGIGNTDQHIVDVGEHPVVDVLRALDRVERGAVFTAADGEDAGGLGKIEAEANRALSQRRADAVRTALANAGFAAGRISAQGQGEDAPVADNMTAAGRAKNRRVEIIYTGPTDTTAEGQIEVINSLLAGG